MDSIGSKEVLLDRGAHWLNLSNTIEPSHPCAAAMRRLCQTTATTCS